MIDSATPRAASPPPPTSPPPPSLTAFEAAPERERLAFVQLYHGWRSLPPDRRAILVRSLFPELSESGVAAMSGVSRRHLYRLPTYQAFKPRLADFKRSRPRADSSKRRRGFSNPNEPFA